jgi:hypothetical protein
MPTTRKPFDPSRFSGNVDCGWAECGGDRGPVEIGLNVRVNGDGEVLVALLAIQGRKEIMAIMGAVGWPQLLAAVKETESVIKQLIDGGKADELAVIVANQR